MIQIESRARSRVKSAKRKYTPCQKIAVRDIKWTTFVDLVVDGYRNNKTSNEIAFEAGVSLSTLTKYLDLDAFKLCIKERIEKYRALSEAAVVSAATTGVEEAMKALREEVKRPGGKRIEAVKLLLQVAGIYIEKLDVGGRISHDVVVGRMGDEDLLARYEIGLQEARASLATAMATASLATAVTTAPSATASSAAP